MSKKNILIGLGLAAVVLFLSLVGSTNQPTESTGGTFNSVKVDFSEGISVDGTTVIDGSGNFTLLGDSTISGTTPSLTIGDAGEEDAQLNFDGNAQDFSLGLDDSVDDFVISKGTALGTTNLLEFTDTGIAKFTGSTDGDLTIYGAGTTASDAYLRLVGDAGADTSDRWQLWNDSSAATLFFQSDPSVAGTYATAGSLTSAGAFTATTSITATTSGSFGGGFGSTGVSISTAGVIDADGLVTGAVGFTATTGAITATAGDLVLTAGRLDGTIDATKTDCAGNAVTLDLSAATNLGQTVLADQAAAAACTVTLSNGVAGETVVLDLIYGGDTAWTLASGGAYIGNTFAEANCQGFQATAVAGDHLIIAGVMFDADTIIPTGCYYADQ